MGQEIWEDIKGYEGYYKISNLGRIKSLHTGFRRHTDIMFTNIVLGYETISLRRDKKSKHFMVHRLIATAFVPNPYNKPFVNHINGVKDDNRIENLEWCTGSENNIHALKTGLKIPIQGERVGGSKLKNNQVLKIFVDARRNEIIAAEYNTTVWSIAAIKRGERWATTTGCKKYMPSERRERLSVEDVKEIYISNLAAHELAAIKNVAKETIFDIRAKRTWKFITDGIDFVPIDRRRKFGNLSLKEGLEGQ